MNAATIAAAALAVIYVPSLTAVAVVVVRETIRYRRRHGRSVAGRVLHRAWTSLARFGRTESAEDCRHAARRQWMDSHAHLLVGQADWHALEYDATRTEPSR